MYNYPVMHTGTHSAYPSMNAGPDTPQPFPLDSCPVAITQAIESVCKDKNVAPEIVVSVYLAAASLTCLPLVEVIPLHTNVPEPVVLDYIIIADSGAGKSTVFKPVMKVFTDFASKCNDIYQEEMKRYNGEKSVWDQITRGLKKNLREATGNYGDREKEERALVEHMAKEPRKPKKFKFIYQDFSRAGLISQLEDNPEAAIFLEEASTFFASPAKDDPALLTLGWDASPFCYVRKGVDYEFTPRLMFCMLTQPDLFNSYLLKNPDSARGSGFLARTLISCTHELTGNTINNAPLRRLLSEASAWRFTSPVDTFNNRVTELLEEARKRFYCGMTDKQQLKLSPHAAAFMATRRAEMQQKIAHGGPWEHIADIALKSGSNALRLAAVFHYFSGNRSEEISENNIKCAHNVIEWYIAQSSKLFWKNSRRYQFERNVLEAYQWIYNKMLQRNYPLILKSEIQTSGPRNKSINLRLADNLNPILTQLIWQERIMAFESTRRGPIYIAIEHPDLDWCLNQQFPEGYTFFKPPPLEGMTYFDLPALIF